MSSEAASPWHRPEPCGRQAELGERILSACGCDFVSDARAVLAASDERGTVPLASSTP
ncbi:MAG: hypothetical protein IPK97_01165 [Ahniella sp.]|nr:hypothetical protein [Ahniella sp.]